MIKCPKCEMIFVSQERVEKHYAKDHPVKKGYEEINPNWNEPVGADV